MRIGANKLIISTFLTLALGIGMAATNRADAQISADLLKQALTKNAQDSLAPNDSSAAPRSQRIVDTVLTIPKLDYANVKLSDALTALGRAYGLSMYVDSSVTGNISMRLDNVSLNDALLFIIRQYKLSWDKTGDIIKIFRPEIPPPPPEPLNISFKDQLLSVNVSKCDLERFVSALSDTTGKNIVLEKDTKGTISSRVTDMALDKALSVIFTANGYTYRDIDGVAYVGVEIDAKAGKPKGRNLNANCRDGLISVDLTNVGLADLIPYLKSECGINLFIQSALEGNISASFTDKTIEEALTYIFINSPYTYKQVGDLYLIGQRTSEDLYVTKLVKLKHLIASAVESLIPATVSKQLSIKVVKEHNGLVLTGPITAISEAESFIDAIDIPMAQVLFEVLVVDYSSTDRAEFGLTANNFGGDSGLPGQSYYPNIDVSGIGSDLNYNLRSVERHLGIGNLGTLDDNFFVRLQMLQQQGKANIRSHPTIAALNGHPASISIGTTQYFLLESKTVYPTEQSSLSTQTSQHFELVEADMKLEITPFVNSSGELIVDIKPEFSTPASTFNPDVPPTINKRVLNSTVRLRNGETIVLGGLVQSSKNEHIEKLPILGSFPILGRLFQNRTSTDVKSELMIYVTPYVYYGAEGSVNRDSLLKR